MEVNAVEPQTWPEPADALVTTAPELLMLVAMLESNCVQSESAKQNVNDAFRRLEDLRQQIARAIEEAQEAEEDAGFWGDISSFLGDDVATIAGVIASAALVVGSGGTATAIVVAALAVGLSAGAEVGEELGLDPKVVMALRIAGAGVALLGGNAAEASQLWGTVHTAATWTQGAAVAGGGAAHAVEGQYEADAVEARALATYLRNNEQLESQLTDDQIVEIGELARQLRFLVESATTISAETDALDRSVIRRIGA